MTLPNFIVVGAAKSGTTSLMSMLGQHPDVFVAPIKEPHHYLFRSVAPNYAGPGDAVMNRHIVQDFQSYERLFGDWQGQRAIGEASVFYLAHPEVFPVIADQLQGPRIIAVLREPAERAYSAYMHLRRDRREVAESFREGLALEDERRRAGWEPLWFYRRLSRYAEGVSAMFEVFGRSRVLLINYDDLRRNPHEVLSRTFGFLGVEADHNVQVRRENISGYVRSSRVQALLEQPSPARQVARSFLSTRVRAGVHDRLRAWNLRQPAVPADVARLRAECAEDVERLAELSGMDLSEWQAPAGAVPLRPGALI